MVKLLGTNTNHGTNQDRKKGCILMPMRVLVVVLLGAFSVGVTMVDRKQMKLPSRIATITNKPQRTARSTNVSEFHPNYTHPTAELSCRRKCTKHDNKIIFHGLPAGIVDREGVLFSLSNIAGYLCATLYINPLQSNLQRAHNFRRPTPADMRFEHLVNITLLENGQKAYEEMLMEAASYVNVVVNSSDFDVQLSTNNAPRQGVSSFVAAENAVSNNQSFVWEISKRANYYKWAIDLFVHLETRTNATVVEEKMGDSRARGISTPARDTDLPFIDNSMGTFVGCPYAPLSFPQHIQATADGIYHNLTKEDPETMLVGYLHIRQGDQAGLCPTNSTELQRYLSCSLNNTLDLGKNITLLFSSDMNDPTERTLWRELQIFPHVQLLDLDSLVQLELQEQVANQGAPQYYLTTFYVFQVVRAIKQKTAFRWQRRKNVCASCDHIPLHYVFNETKEPLPPISFYGQFS